MLTREEILDYLAKYKSEKEKRYHIKRLGIFGSFARGDATEESDIDIVVDFEKPDLLNQVGIMQELREAFGRHVDVVALWEHMNPKLLRRINKDAIYV